MHVHTHACMHKIKNKSKTHKNANSMSFWAQGIVLVSSLWLFALHKREEQSVKDEVRA